jgi:hypothetical protein
MPRDLHGVMEDTADAEQVGMDMPVEEEVSRTLDDAVLGPRSFSTMTQMVAAYSFAKLGSGNAASPVGPNGNVS